MEVDLPARIPANVVVVRLRATVTSMRRRGSRRGLVYRLLLMKTCLPARFAALPLAWAVAGPALSQSTAPEAATGQLKETVVTASRNEQLLSQALPHTTVITRQDIERAQAIDLPSLLQREAGLQRTQNGGIGTVSSVFLRGVPSLQTLVLIDGVPLNKQDASGAISLQDLMLDHIERVEIVRGNVSAIYGSGAIGGVIQIFTRTGSGQPRGTVSLDLATRDTYKLYAGASGTFGNTSLSIGASRFHTEGFSAVRQGQFSQVNPDRDGYDNTALHLSATHRLERDHSVGMRVTQSRGDADYDNTFGAPADVQFSRTRLQQASVFSDNRWGDWRSRLSYSDQADRNLSSDNGFFGSDDRFKTRARVLNWTHTLALSHAWLATAGVERQWQSVDTDSTSAFVTPYAVKRTATAVFGGVEGQIGSHALQANLRHDEITTRKTTGYLGYGYLVTPGLKLVASASTAFNAAPLGYLYAPVFGNASLVPETARSNEVGLQFEQGAHLVRATAFRTRIRDELQFDVASNQFANISSTRNQGFELSYRGRAGNTDLRASLTSQDPINATTGQRLNRRAATLANLDVSHAFGPLRAGVDLLYSGDRPDVYTDPATFSSVNTTLGAYTVANLTVSYKLADGLELRGKVENIGNKRYQTVYGYNQTPRSWTVGLTWTPRF